MEDIHNSGVPAAKQCEELRINMSEQDKMTYNLLQLIFEDDDVDKAKKELEDSLTMLGGLEVLEDAFDTCIKEYKEKRKDKNHGGTISKVVNQTFLLTERELRITRSGPNSPTPNRFTIDIESLEDIEVAAPIGEPIMQFRNIYQPNDDGGWTIKVNGKVLATLRWLYDYLRSQLF